MIHRRATQLVTLASAPVLILMLTALPAIAATETPLIERPATTNAVHETRLEQPSEDSMMVKTIYVKAGVAAALNVLVGTMVRCDASDTEGNPSALEWRITEPGGAPPASPSATGPDTTFLVSSAGTWQIELTAIYDHDAPAGTPYVSIATAQVTAQNVVADLQTAATQYDTEDEISLDGAASTWATGVSPDISWSMTGPTFYDCGSSLSCTIPAGALDPGSYTVSLTLTDPVSTDTDTAQVAFAVVLAPSLGVDFGWSPINPDPGEGTVFTVNVTPPTTIISCITWTWGDGQVVESCPCYGVVCSTGSHMYQTAGWYTIELEVETSEGDTLTESHVIQVGDPPEPPTASFSVDPGSPTVMQATMFSLTGSCDAPCIYTWTFGDGTVSNLASPVHSYDHHGSFSVELTLENDGGTDSASETVIVGDCWSPPTPIQQGSCHGGDVVLIASGGTEYLWSTGSSTSSTVVGLEGLYWVSEADATSSCWGTADLTVVLSNCGDPGGDANLDSVVDAADLGALIQELGDGDGTAVSASGNGDRGAPGGDVNQDDALTSADALAVIEALFSP